MTKNLSYYENYRSLKKLHEIKSLEFKKLDPSWDRAEKLRNELIKCEKAMEQVRDAIESYVPSDASPRVTLQMNDERIFLECRYIQGMTMEKTADAMCVSRDTAYRIRRRIVSRYKNASEN